MLGVEDMDRKLLLTVDDKTLCRLCQVNREIYKLGSNDGMWRDKLLIKYPKVNLLLGKNHILYIGLRDYNFVNKMANDQDFEILEWLDTHFSIRPGSIAMCTSGNLKVLDWLWKKGCYFSEMNAHEAAL